MSKLPLLLLSVGAFGCAEGFHASIANQGPAGEGMGAFLSLRGNDGEIVTPTEDDTVVEVQTRSPGGAWTDASSVTVEHVTPPLIDTVIVADNSGSEADYEAEITAAVDHFAHTILVREPPDRMGLVRVSTVSQVLQPLTTSEEEMRAAATGQLFVNRGWTALWDGVRLANETLAADALLTTDTGMCMDRAFRSIVVFTDGQDNNSSDEQATSYEGDGIDTTLDDLLDLQVYGARTVVHVVGVGNDIDHEALEILADATGGKTKAIPNFMGLQGALHGTAAQLEHHTPFCFVPASCGHTEAKVVVRREVRNNRWETREFEMPIPSNCPL